MMLNPGTQKVLKKGNQIMIKKWNKKKKKKE